MLRLVRQELRQIGYSEEEIDGGGLRVTTTFTPEAMQAAGRACWPRSPRASVTRSCTSRPPRSSPAPARCSASTAARTPSTPDQLGGGRRHGRVDVQAVHAGHGDHRGVLARGHLRGRLALTSSPTASRCATRAAADGNDYGSEVAATYRWRSRSTRRSSTCRASIPDGPEKIRRHGQRARHPAREARPRSTPVSRRVSHDLSSDDALITLGRARISPINMANAYATIADGGVRANVARDQEGRGPQRRGRRRSTTSVERRRARPRHRRRRLLRHAAGRPAAAPARPPWSWAARPPARPAPPPTTRTRFPRRGSWASPPRSPRR